MGRIERIEAILALVLAVTLCAASAQDPAVPEDALGAIRQGEAALSKPETMYQSVDHFHHAIELAPDYAPAYLGLAEAYFALKQFADAREPLEKAVSLDPENGRAYLMLGTVYKLAGDHARAVEALSDAVRMEPDSYEAHFELAFAMMRKDRDFEAAEIHARAAHALDSDRTQSHILLYTVAAARALDFRLIEEELLHILESDAEGAVRDRAAVLLEQIHQRLEAQGKAPRFPNRKSPSE